MSIRIETSNHQKYQDATRNPVVRALMDQLFARVRERLELIRPDSFLDAGCGEGHALEKLGDVIPSDYQGVDINPSCIEYCRQVHAGRSFSCQSLYGVDFPDQRFDAALCMEVLEHVDRPEAVLAELCRVVRRELVLTVPWEPWFQLGNLARGKYPSTFGNHPEHVQHWGPRSFRRFLDSTGLLEVVSVRPAGVWIVASARVKR